MEEIIGILKKKTCIMRSFLLVLPIYYNDQIKEGEAAGECSLHGKQEKCIQSFGRKA
jgi:hypothetical protein